MIQVVILQRSVADRPEHVVWKGQGKVVRCAQEGVVLDLNASGASWWSRLWGNISVKYIVPRWIQKPFSVPYCDLALEVNPTSGEKWLVIDAITWKRSPKDLARAKNIEDGEEKAGEVS